MTAKVENKTEEITLNPYDQYTNNALKDVILYQISSKKKRKTDGDRPRNSYWTVGGDDTLEWINLKYAYLYLHRFFLIKPRKPFDLHKSDLTSPLIERLEPLDFRELNAIMINVVRRILEAVDSYYYHISGIHDKVSWRFVN
ncbi:MAG: hypothetical protein ACRD8Z_14770 [Nitrososphaeraceae archaeon]